jgi:circadian clock protein KaiC
VQDELNKSYVEDELKKEIMDKNRSMIIEKRQNKNAFDGKKK